MLEEIREIRLSERQFYQKVTDLYATAVDYDKNAKTPELKEIETQEEWDVISDILNKLETKVRNGEITASDEDGE